MKKILVHKICHILFITVVISVPSLMGALLPRNSFHLHFNWVIVPFKLFSPLFHNTISKLQQTSEQRQLNQPDSLHATLLDHFLLMYMNIENIMSHDSDMVVLSLKL